MTEVKNQRLNVTGSLHVIIDEVSSNINGTGDVINLELSLVDKVLTNWGRKLPQEAKKLNAIGEIFRNTGLTIRILNKNRPVMVVGKQARPGLLNKMFKSTNIQWKPTMALLKFALKHKKQHRF